VHIPSFLGSWGFLLASDWARPGEWRADDIARTIEDRLGLAWLDHVNPEFLKAAFCLCKETQFLLSQPGPVLEDGVDFIPPPNIEDIEPPYAQFPIKPAG
jgi:spermidine synthase